jgi:leucyl aminopeptidase
MTEVASVVVVPRDHGGTDLILAGCFEREAPDGEGVSPEVRAALERLAARGGWAGKDDQVVQAEIPGGPIVSLFGLGERKDFSFEKLSQWIGRASDHARVGGDRRRTFLLPRHAGTAGTSAAERILRSVALSTYSYDRFQTQKERRPDPEILAVAPPAGEEETFRAALPFALEVAAAVRLARDLANTPPNEATPAWMEERACELAAEHGLEATVFDVAELRRRGMGGLLAVGAGAAVPPRLVKLSWGDSGPVVALVGKGITFDTGGISIKPAADMDEMKYDKAGACAVLAAARAIAGLRLPVRLRVYAPLAENTPSHTAYRPGDILRMANGKTVEITNTDAEGRLILADALALAVEEGAEALIELSTLTGHCVVALGHQAAGLFAPEDAFAAELLAASAAAGERLWRLPMYPEFTDEMKGTHADLKNSAGRPGGASTAAAFLAQFVGGLSTWAHLDIAGTAYVKTDKDGQAAGATGFGVASAVSWVRHRARHRAASA